jgi:hypothetical protein
MIEVDETDFLQKTKLSELVGKMMKNEEARKMVLTAQKTVEPNNAIPEIDSVKPVQAAITALSDKFETVVKELRDDRAKEKEDARLAKLQNQWKDGQQFLREHGYNEEGIKKVEELMEARGIASHSDAAKIFEFDNPPPPPATPTGSGSFNLFEVQDRGDDYKELLASRGNSEAVLRKMTDAAIAEVKGQRR